MILPASVGAISRHVPPLLLAVVGACAVGAGTVGLVNIPPVLITVSGTSPMSVGTVGLDVPSPIIVAISGSLPMEGTVGLQAVDQNTVLISGALPMSAGTIILAVTPLIAASARVLWIKGDDGTGVADASPLGQTASVSGTLTSGATANSHSSIFFDGVSNYATYLDGSNAHADLISTINSRDFTILMVVASTSATGTALSLSRSATDGYDQLLPDYTYLNAGKPAYTARDTSNTGFNILSTSAANYTTPRVFRVRYQSGSIDMSINGGINESVSLTTRSNNNRVTIGAIILSVTTNYDEMDLFELQIVKNTASQTEIGNEVEALKTKYGIYANITINGTLPMSVGTVGLVAAAPVNLTINGVLPIGVGTVGLNASDTVAASDRVLWIKGDDGTGFTDASPLGQSATIGGTLSSGATANGHSSILFDSGTDYATYVDGSNAHADLITAVNSQNFSILMVVRSSSNDNGAALCLNHYTSVGYDILMPDNSSNSSGKPAYAAHDVSDGAHNIFSTVATNFSTPRLFRVRYQSGSINMSIDGGSNETTTFTTRSNNDRVTVGTILRSSNPSGVLFDTMDMFELQIVKSTASQVAIDAEVASLKIKYGI